MGNLKKILIALLIFGLTVLGAVVWLVAQFGAAPEGEEEEITLVELFGDSISASSGLSAKQEGKLLEGENMGCSSHTDCSKDEKCYGIPGGTAFCRVEAPTCGEFCGETVTCHFRGEDPIRLVCD